jgi:sulfite reductase (NADPH) hemoprotein beta-component
MPADTFETVSRIASLLSSHLVISSSLPTPSSSRQSLRTTRLFPHVDPSELILKRSSEELTTLLLSSSSSSFSSLLPSLTKLVNTPLVAHIQVGQDDDLSPVLALRGSGWVVLKSESAVESADTALLASKLAKESGRAVIHVYSSGKASRQVANGNGHVNGNSEESSIPSEEEITTFFSAQTIDLNGSAAHHASTVPNLGHLNDVPKSDEEVFVAYESAALATLKLTRRAQIPYHYSGSTDAETAIVTFGVQTEGLNDLVEQSGEKDVGVLQINLLRPLAPGRLLAALPSSVKKVVVLEQAFKKSTRWGAVFLDVLSALQAKAEVDEETDMPEIIGATLGSLTKGGDVDTLKQVLQGEKDVLGSIPEQEVGSTEPHVPKIEEVYTNILDQTFPGRLDIVNSPSLVPALGQLATRPEYAFGKVSALLDERDELAQVIKDVLKDKSTGDELHKVAARWLVGKDAQDSRKVETLGKDLVVELEKSSKGASGDLAKNVKKALALKDHVKPVSRWIIGSDAWSYDLGSSGIHHAIASGKNVNMLIIDTQPYTTRGSKDAAKRKKDIGLYAMNHGDVYVASVAVYSSYSQVLQAFLAADAYPGPSIVLAYLPYGEDENATALEVLKETKLAVDTAYWPLYRWDPSQEDIENGKPFMLDSVRIKEAMKEFLDRQNHLSQLTAAEPKIASQVISSVGTELKDARRQKAKAAYEKLMNAMDGPPLLILYASDGGNAEKVAKKLASRAKTRGLATRLVTMDDFGFEDIKLEGHVVFFTSTAGQGEAPQNGRTTFKALMAASESGDWASVNFTVFGMGDSHYWPGEDGAKYYNKPAKEIDARLEKLGAQRMADIGLGDDQDPDGAQTGYKAWEPLLWKAMGVDSVEVLEAEPEPITNENIKIASNYLRGTILEGLADKSTGAIDPSDAQLTKFHGTYMQDDRDIREERKDQGLEPAYSFMIRCRMPGGVCKPEQWLAIDDISDEHGNGTFKLTTRQTFQFHGIIKKHLKPAMQAINRTLLDTIAACGDVNRNVQLSVNPSYSKLHEQVYDFSKALSEHLLPSTTAYHEIWLDKKLVAGEAVKDFEPLYGPYYLPRKFKIAIAVPPDNSVDVFTNDVGFIAITDEQGELAGFNVTVGGGMGVTHSNKKTYPRLGDVIGFVTPEEGCLVAEKIMLSQRDNGNRADRKNARLKYTVDRMGVDNFKADVEKRLGHALAPARPYTFEQNIDNFGWIKGHNGKWHFTMFIENGRVEDNAHHQFKSGLREIAKAHKGDFRLTANQHCILSDVAEEDKPEMERLLAKWKLDKVDHSALRLSSSACVAFPTCGLAMAESERYLPVLVDKLEKITEEAGLRNDSIVMRMTGCPNVSLRLIHFAL